MLYWAAHRIVEGVFKCLCFRILQHDPASRPISLLPKQGSLLIKYFPKNLSLQADAQQISMNLHNLFVALTQYENNPEHYIVIPEKRDMDAIVSLLINVT